MLKLLLDEHISPAVCAGFARRNKTFSIEALSRFEQGRMLGSSDEELLAQLERMGRTLVTYDLRTIPRLLKSWSEQNRSHGGVIFVDDKTISPAKIGGLIRALTELAISHGREVWTNRVIFLTR